MQRFDGYETDGRTVCYLSVAASSRTQNEREREPAYKANENHGALLCLTAKSKSIGLSPVRSYLMLSHLYHILPLSSLCVCVLCGEMCSSSLAVGSVRPLLERTATRIAENKLKSYLIRGHRCERTKAKKRKSRSTATTTPTKTTATTKTTLNAQKRMKYLFICFVFHLSR